MASFITIMPTTTAADTIPDLPPELFYEIAANADKQVLNNLRKTSKLFRHVSHKLFAQAFFTEVVFPLTPTSIRSLSDLSKDKVLAPFIRTVIISQSGREIKQKYHKFVSRIISKLFSYGNKISIGVRSCRLDDTYYEWARNNIVRLFKSQMTRPIESKSTSLHTVVVDILSNPGLSVRYWDWSAWQVFQSLVDRSTQSIPFVVELRLFSSFSEPPTGRVLVSNANTCFKATGLVAAEIEELQFRSGLREIHLQDCEIEQDVLRRWMRRSRHTLKTVVFEGVCLVDRPPVTEPDPFRPFYHIAVPGDWNAIINDSLLLYDLEHCRLSQLWNSKKFIYLGDFGEVFDFTGVDNIRRRLENMMNVLNASYVDDE